VGDYRKLAVAFAERAIADGRKLVYVRFAPHEPILSSRAGLDILELDPLDGFEGFTVAVHRAIEAAGVGAFYVFDCLSELQTAWAADLMMGNFFAVTCPYLFELDTVAWFCLIRDRHGNDTVARIRDTTQLMIDLRPDGDGFYVHPIKVWKRYSPTMFFPHSLRPGASDEAPPLTDGVSVSRFYRAVGVPGDGEGAGHMDSWERFFIAVRKAVAENPAQANRFVEPLAERLIGSDPRFSALVLRNCSASDLLEIKDRLIGSGKIGGKAAGLIVARKIVERMPGDVPRRLEPHDSFYVGTDVFYTYLVQNRLWPLRIRQRTEAGYFAESDALRVGILEGEFPDQIRERFRRTLEYFGQTPIIVRSSSLLEDSFGHAFAGKYESVFCANSGSPEDRLKAFEAAVRAVYASVMDRSALAYRRQRGLQAKDEQMAILVQRVSGSLYGGYFLPAVAGVGHSFSAWRWHPDVNPAAGMVRLVIGLGTRAVDRTGGDYPRLVSLDRPDLEPTQAGDRAEYCQRSVDALDLAGGGLTTVPLEEILPRLPPWLASLLAERDVETERRLAEIGQTRQITIGTCAGVVAQRALLDDLAALMRRLQEEYENPVDVEFTVNWSSEGEYLINLLQCRPLQTPGIPDAPGGESATAERGTATGFGTGTSDVSIHESGFFEALGTAMGPPSVFQVDVVVQIDPRAYYLLPYRDKPSVARAVGELSYLIATPEKNALLLAPGRIGTSSPELGVPLSFAEISGFRAIVEIAYDKAGYRPELSFGSHFFQDLVESGMQYAAIKQTDPPTSYDPSYLAAEPDRFRDYLPGSSLPDGLIRVYEPVGLAYYSDVRRGGCACRRA